MVDAESEAVSVKRARQGRSPSYPFISLRKALEQANALYRAEGKYAAPLPSAFQAWGFGSKSSGGRQTLAALRYFGLIEVEGEGDARKVKVSDAALRVLLDEREDLSERDALLRQFALSPSINQEIFDRFPNGLGSDGSVKHFLIFECDFNEGAAAEVLAQFKETSDFANVFKPSAALDNTVVRAPAGNVPFQLPEGTDEPRGSALSVTPAAPAPEAEEETWLRGPLSSQTRYKIMVAGKMGPKEIGKLIKLLEAQKDVLSDDDDI